MAKESSKSSLVHEKYEGYIMDLVIAVADAADLNYTLHFTSGYNDLIQNLIDDQLDLVIADLTVTNNRADKIDFSIPFMTSGIAILMRKPSITDPDPFSFLKPFSISIWLGILSAYVVVSCSLCLLTR